MGAAMGLCQGAGSAQEVEVDEVTVASLVLVDVGASDQDSYSRFDGMASSCTTFTLPTNVSGKSGMSLPSNGSRAVSWQKRRSLMMMHSVSLDSTRSSQLPCKVDKAKVAAFQASLRLAGLNTSQWGQNGSNTVEHLYWEAYHQQGCLLTGLKVMGKLKRITHLVKIRLFANIMGEESELFTRLQLLHDGRCKEREQVLVRRLRWTSVDLDCEDKVDESFYAPDCPHTEAWREGVENALAERLGLPASWQREHLREEVGAVSTFEVEDDVRSGTYPGLPTMFCIHTTTLRVVDVESPAVQRLGLPTGQEFATTEGQFTFGRQDEEGPRIGSQLNIWTWRRQRTPVVTTASAGSQEAKEPDLAPKETNRASSFNSLEARLSAVVPLPMTRCAREGPSRPCPPGSSPNAALWRMLDGRSTDWGRVSCITKRITDPDYSLKMYYADLSAFPELSLYLPARGSDDEKCTASDFVSPAASSGRTTTEEYQRTVGAFFAIYWLLRLDGDGRDGFSFGVDEEWVPISAQSRSSSRVPFAEKRAKFDEEAKWEFLRGLLVNAGVLQEKKKLFGRGTYFVVNEKRLTSLLALTAIHDIMKMDQYCPVVEADHAPYHGYSAGDTIGDHDHALSYIMDFFPNLLPSFRDLSPEERRSVQFTQCSLCFNHGWLVQAEAPPGAIFTRMRETLIRDHKLMIGQRDIALYFVHWFTDLAGAEPTPLAGCEKFSHKFPVSVLNSFIKSFSFVGRIAAETETAVLERYLKMRWEEDGHGTLPEGPDAVARMRLACMAQANAARVLEAFARLPDEERELLSLEMGRTACMSQSYSKGLVLDESRDLPGGPAFLVYYGPAFLQSLGGESAATRLGVLSEIYRCARALWPSSAAAVACTVTIRIDTIKALSTAAMRDAMVLGDMWILVKHNNREAFIERSSKRKLNRFIQNGQSIQVLDLSLLQC